MTTVTDNEQINLHIESIDYLKHRYMTFVKHGGLIIDHNQPLQMHQELILNLTLFNQDEQQVVKGKVVWLAPVSANSSDLTGYGLEFTGPNATNVRQIIEQTLAKSPAA